MRDHHYTEIIFGIFSLFRAFQTVLKEKSVFPKNLLISHEFDARPLTQQHKVCCVEFTIQRTLSDRQNQQDYAIFSISLFIHARVMIEEEIFNNKRSPYERGLINSSNKLFTFVKGIRWIIST